MLGMEMMMQSLGVDPAKLQQNVDTAVAHVKAINDGMNAIGQRLAVIEQATASILQHAVATGATTLRIEDAVNKLRTDSPDNSTGFAALVNETFPVAAEQMQQQVEGEINAGTEHGTDRTEYVNGNANQN